MDKVMEIFNQYKTYIVRGVVGAVLATVLWAIDMPIWLNGAIIALVSGIAGDFVQKHLDAQLETMNAKKAAAADSVKETASDLKDAAADATETVKKTAKKTVKKAAKKAD